MPDVKKYILALFTKLLNYSNKVISISYQNTLLIRIEFYPNQFLNLFGSMIGLCNLRVSTLMFVLYFLCEHYIHLFTVWHFCVLWGFLLSIFIMLIIFHFSFSLVRQGRARRLIGCCCTSWELIELSFRIVIFFFFFGSTFSFEVSILF